MKEIKFEDYIIEEPYVFIFDKYFLIRVDKGPHPYTFFNARVKEDAFNCTFSIYFGLLHENSEPDLKNVFLLETFLSKEKANNRIFNFFITNGNILVDLTAKTNYLTKENTVIVKDHIHLFEITRTN